MNPNIAKIMVRCMPSLHVRAKRAAKLESEGKPRHEKLSLNQFVCAALEVAINAVEEEKLDPNQLRIEREIRGEA